MCVCVWVCVCVCVCVVVVVVAVFFVLVNLHLCTLSRFMHFIVAMLYKILHSIYIHNFYLYCLKEQTSKAVYYFHLGFWQYYSTVVLFFSFFDFYIYISWFFFPLSFNYLFSSMLLFILLVLFPVVYICILICFSLPFSIFLSQFVYILCYLLSFCHLFFIYFRIGFCLTESKY